MNFGRSYTQFCFHVIYDSSGGLQKHTLSLTNLSEYLSMFQVDGIDDCAIIWLSQML